MLIYAGWVPHDKVRRGAASLYGREFMYSLSSNEGSPFRYHAPSVSLGTLVFMQLSPASLCRLPK